MKRPQSLVQEYLKLLVEFGLNNQRLLDRIQTQLERCKTNILETQQPEQVSEVE